MSQNARVEETKLPYASFSGTERQRNQAARGDSHYDTIQSVCFCHKTSSDLEEKRGRINHLRLFWGFFSYYLKNVVFWFFFPSPR